MKNLTWNLIFIFDLGGVLALGLYAWARWPDLIQISTRCVDVFLCLAGPGLVVALVVGFVHARLTEYKWRNN